MATIVISAEKVIEAAEATITEILEAREEINQKTVAQYIMNNTPGRIGRFFGRKTPNEFQAIQHLRKDFDFPDNYSFGKQLNHAKRLLKLAQNGDPVTLNETDCDMIF